MVKYLAIGCMGTGEDKGLYFFDWQESAFKATPEARFDDLASTKREHSSPKDLLDVGSFLYTLTKSALFNSQIQRNGAGISLTVTPSESSSPFCFPLSEIKKLCADEKDQKAFFAIFDEPGKVTGHLTTHKNNQTNSIDVLMSVYREENLKEEVTPGFLIRFPGGNLQEAEIVGREVTGPAVVYGENVYYARGHELIGPAESIPFPNPYSQILSATVTRTSVGERLEEILSAVSTMGEYIIKSKEGEIHNPRFEEESLFSEEQRHLPSEATAVAVVNHEEELYVLFGLNRGKLRIYQKNGLGLKFLKTIDFLNEYDRVYNKESIEDHIKNIIWKEGDGEIYLSFLSRAFRFSLGELITAAKSDKEVVLQEVLDYIQLEPKVRKRITSLSSSEEKVAAKVIDSIVNWTKDTHDQTLEEVVKGVAGDSSVELTQLLSQSQVHDHRYLRRMMERIRLGKKETTDSFSARYHARKVQGIRPRATFEVPHRITRMIALE